MTVVSVGNDFSVLKIISATKYFSPGVPVLQKVNLTVEKGTIYALLGQSGCGKTTLLSCIVGLQRLCSGNIEIFGRDVSHYRNGVPGSVLGYMPQEIALYESFTILEIFSYYGLLHSLSEEGIQSKLEELQKLLKLPNLDKYVNEISGGERRRVSLGVALLHDPRLLILDEPTVSIDPLLRQKIWAYITNLVKTQQTTLLITTHYVEETTQSDKIGYLRDGTILAEDSPQNLLKTYNATLLNDAILQVCKIKRDNQQQENLASQITFKHGRARTLAKKVELTAFRRFGKDERSSTWQKSGLRDDSQGTTLNSARREFKNLKALTKRNWILYIRFKTLFAIQIVTLLMGCFLAINVIGNDPVGLKLGVVNYDGGPCLNGEKSVKEVQNLRFYDRFGCQLLQSLGSDGVTTNLIQKDTEQEALLALKMGHILGYIVIPRNYSEHLRNRIFFNIHSDNETLHGSTISLRFDNSNYLVSYFARQYISSNMFQFMDKLVKKLGIDERKVNLPLKFHPIHGSLTDTWNIFIAPSYLLIIWATNCCLCALFHNQDKIQTSLSRTLATGVNYRTIIFSHYVTDVLIMLPQIFVMFTYLWWDRGDMIKGSWATILLIFYILRVNITSLTMLAAESSKTFVNATFLLLAVFWVSLYASDTFWPIESVAWWYRPFCYCLPLTNPNRLLRRIMTRGWGIKDPAVLYYGISIPLIVSLVAFIATVRIGNKR